MLKGMVEVEFTIEQEEKLKKYLEEEWFEELNEKLNMYESTASIQTKLQHIMKYIINYCKTGFNVTKEDVENFFDLLLHYENGSYREPKRDENGLIELEKSGFNSGNGFYMGKIKPMRSGSGEGLYAEGIFITTDGKEYIKKLAMDSKGKYRGCAHHEQSRYNGTIAHEIFEYFGEKSASYLPAIKSAPNYYIISENFLGKNQELISFSDFYQTKPENEYYKHSATLELLESNLRIRYKNNLSEEDFNKLINRLKVQYIKQEFIKKLIGIGDENLGNVAIVLTMQGEKTIPEIELSPAFDLDVSFNFAEEANMTRKTTDKGRTDIRSFIEEFKDVSGFRDFLSMMIEKMENEDRVLDEILDKSYDSSKAIFFKKEEKREDYKKYLKEKFRETREAYQELYIKSERSGEKDDIEAVLE